MPFVKQKSKIGASPDKILLFLFDKEVVLNEIETIKSEELAAWIKSGNVSSLSVVRTPIPKVSQSDGRVKSTHSYILVVEFNHVVGHRVMISARGDVRKWTHLQTVIEFITETLGYDNTENDIHIILQTRKEI